MDKEQLYGRARHWQSRLDTFVGNARLDYQSSLYDISDCISRDSALSAVVGFEPIGKFLSAFARFARNAASGDVFSVNYSRVVYDVLPCRYRFSRLFG